MTHRKLPLVVALLFVVASITFDATAGGTRKKAAAPAPEAPPPNATLSVAPVSPTRWTLRVENTGAAPLQLTADPRLLTLDVTPVSAPSDGKAKRTRAPKLAHCTLPADARPSEESVRVVVVPPGKAYTDSFDPRFYCFTIAQAAALTSGASVVARLGKKGAEIVASPITLGDSAAPPAVTEHAGEAPKASASTGGDDTMRLELTAAPRVDALTADDASITVTLSNAGAHAISAMFRPGSVGFDVTAPFGAGQTRCSAASREAIRELTTSLAPRGRASVTVLPSAVCPGHTFDLPGLYEIRPRIDTRSSAGADVGVKLFAGEVIGPPSLLRVRRGREGAPLPAPRIE